MKAVLSLFFFSSLAFAETPNLGMDYNFTNPYDVVTPALNGDPSGADRQVGQVYLDVSSGAGDAGTLKAIGKDGSILPISNGANLPIVSGGATERVERATVIGTTVSTSSSSWIAAVSNPSTGNYSVTIDSSVFSASPSCIVVAGQNERVVSGVTVASATSVLFEVRKLTSPIGDYVNSNFNIVCIGPRVN